VLALPLVALAAAIGLDRPGPKGERVRLFHGTTNLEGVLRIGQVKPSIQTEDVKGVTSCIRWYRTLQDEAAGRAEVDGHLDSPEEYVEGATADWENMCLIPMHGFSYASTDLAVARFYASDGASKGGVVEVVPTSGIVVPDEDWMGMLCVKVPPVTELLGIHGDGSNLMVRGDPAEFLDWTSRLAGLLNRDFLTRISAEYHVVSDEISFGGFDMAALRASLGKTILREAMRTPTGQRWLIDGLQFATEVAHHGPLEVVGVVRSDAVHPSPATDQYGDVWVVDGKVSA
jgi:hypothetical protein